MGAAAFGRMVELNPKRMACISTLLFFIGMMMVYASLQFHLLPFYYLGCSFMGCGTGIGYVSPIKQLLSNFSDHKGLASGLAITIPTQRKLQRFGELDIVMRRKLPAMACRLPA